MKNKILECQQALLRISQLNRGILHEILETYDACSIADTTIKEQITNAIANFNSRTSAIQQTVPEQQLIEYQQKLEKYETIQQIIINEFSQIKIDLNVLSPSPSTNYSQAWSTRRIIESYKALKSFKTQFIQLRNLADDVFKAMQLQSANSMQDQQKLTEDQASLTTSFDNLIKLLDEIIAHHPKFSTKTYCITYIKETAIFTLDTLKTLFGSLQKKFKSLMTRLQESSHIVSEYLASLVKTNPNPTTATPQHTSNPYSTQPTPNSSIQPIISTSTHDHSSNQEITPSTTSPQK